MVYLEPESCLLWALLLLTLPLPWLLSALLAGLIHEICHIVVVQLWGGAVERIRIGLAGAQIEADIPSEKGKFLAVLAGPSGSLLLCLLWPWQTRLAVCGFVQGMYNLLPVYPLDGGKLLTLLLERYYPEAGKGVQTAIEATVLVALWIVGTQLISEKWKLFLLLVPVCGRLRRKIPCKPREFAVQ